MGLVTIKVKDIVPELREAFTGIQSKIDLKNRVSSNDVESIKDNIKCLATLKDGLIFAHSQCTTRWQKNAHIVFNSTLSKTLEKLEKMQIQVNYMQKTISEQSVSDSIQDDPCPLYERP